MCHRKMEKQTSNDKSVKTPMLPEPFGDNKSSLLLPQVQANHYRSKSPRRFLNGPASPSQCLRHRCSDRRKRSWIQQIRSKFLLQK
jgi:hypothetical protein